jgi:PEP-CTERM motif
MPRSPRLVVAFAIAVQVSAAGAAADPVRVTSGSLSFDTGDPPAFSLMTSSGQLFVAEGFRTNWPATCFFDCSPGAAIPISIAPTETTDGSMFFQADGVDLFAVMNLVIDAPPVTLGSDIGTPNGPFEEIFRRPFTFAGQLTGYPSPDRVGTPVFDLTLTGRGTARLSMTRENGRYSFSSLDYNFETDPVPEPATLFLVGAGATLMWRRRSAHS